MAEVTEAGHDHGHAVVAAEGYRVGVADRAAGLDDGIDTGLVGCFDTIGEGEESVGCHYGAFEAEAEAGGLFDGMTQGIDARGLADARGDELTVAGKHDGVALGVLHDFVGEEKICHKAVAEIVA